MQLDNADEDRESTSKAPATGGGLVRRLDGTGWKVWVARVTGGWLLALGFYLLWIA